VNRLLMIAAVAFGAYTLLEVALSALVAIVWRTRAVAPANLPPVVRARHLLWLRLVPAGLAAVITLTVVTPAFAIFEPFGLNERLGPAIAMLAGAGVLQWAVAIIRAVYSLVLTRRIERGWLQSSSVLDVDASMPAFAIDSHSPILALVGVFSPKLIAASTIVDACSPEELACIVGHEHGHWQAGDNLKRWVMASLPDTLHWTPIHGEIVEAWHHAAEDAADDATSGSDVRARAELAALLIKVVRLAPHPLWHAAIVSPFVERDGLERRVRRLLQPDLEPPAPLAIVPMLAVVAIGLTAIAVLLSPAAMERVFDAFERLVALGR
jgi:Zn-dependent protease with chaperone function